MQYFLRKDQISLLHKKYDTRYPPIIYTNALNTIKVPLMVVELDGLRCHKPMIKLSRIYLNLVQIYRWLLLCMFCYGDLLYVIYNLVVEVPHIT